LRRSTPDLDIVVPVYNEEARLGATLRALTDHTATLPLDVRITVVDNGSVDRSTEVLDEVAADRPGNTALRVIGCSRQGKGAAVRRGLLAGTARWRGFCDADLSTPPQVLTDVVPHLRDGRPVVIGSRRCAGASYAVAQPLVRRLGSSAFRAITRPLVGDVADTQCGFKFFSAEAAEQIFRRVTANGFAFDVEVLAVAARLGMPVVEVPVRWTDQPGSSFGVWTHGRRVVSEVRAVHSALARMS
jgi:dolichyl-phosphate beta-glucosyltransferase